MEKIDLDDKDRKIISIFEENPEASQADIAQQVSLSQPTVGARIQKLRQSGALESTAGIDLKRMGLNLAKVDLTTRGSIDIIKQFKGCPYFLNGMIVSGRENLCLFFVAEDIATIEALVDRHLRSNPAVSAVELGIVISQVYGMVQPVKMALEKSDKSQCGLDCSECQYYQNNQCLGCPATKYYKGKFW
ncbi:MAG: putative HTH-type transcriptional regulator [Methanocella sp. PtaU1.Bin125]|nr:MAG: putative HTH-type transcriptional regulator [Methanocella sp. PtaU1.Bin125]